MLFDTFKKIFIFPLLFEIFITLFFLSFFHYCKKLKFLEVICTELPQIKNGRIVLNGVNHLVFGDSAHVECNNGFRNVGADSIKCLANRTLSGQPKCRDIDECALPSSGCAVKTTICNNLEGSYYCQCQKGFQSQLSKHL